MFHPDSCPFGPVELNSAFMTPLFAEASVALAALPSQGVAAPAYHFPV